MRVRIIESFFYRLNSANQYRSHFYIESLSCWESRSLKSAAPKRLHWDGCSLEMAFFFLFLEEISALVSLRTEFRNCFSVTLTTLKCSTISLKSFYFVPRVSTLSHVQVMGNHMWAQLYLFSCFDFPILFSHFPLVNFGGDPLQSYSEFLVPLCNVNLFIKLLEIFVTPKKRFQ